MAPELEEWVDRVFGQAEPSTKDTSRLDGICGPDQVTLLRLVDVFENSATLLKPYADAVLDQAFWDLGSEALSAVADPAIDWGLRSRLIASVEPLFRGLFAVRCTSTLGHQSQTGTGLNPSCYMWWDFNCWLHAPEPLTWNLYDSALLASMQSILAIDHIACMESALHGLGHWCHLQRSPVESIIDDFLGNRTDLPGGLRDYALDARRGCVL